MTDIDFLKQIAKEAGQCMFEAETGKGAKRNGQAATSRPSKGQVSVL